MEIEIEVVGPTEHSAAAAGTIQKLLGAIPTAKFTGSARQAEVPGLPVDPVTILTVVLAGPAVIQFVKKLPEIIGAWNNSRKNAVKLKFKKSDGTEIEIDASRIDTDTLSDFLKPDP